MQFASDLELTRLSDCPRAAVWSGFLRGGVDQPTLDSLSDHLHHCSGCLQLVDELSSHPLVGDRTVVRSPFLDEDHFGRLLDRVSQLRLASEPVTLSDDGSTRSSIAVSLPEAIGRFSIRGVLGTGGFGRVYLADDPLLRRSVAIKVPRRSAFGTDGDMADFLNEARHAAALDHPGIVPIYDVLEDNEGRALIVMKHVDGQTLSMVMREGPLPLTRTVRLMIQIARAVHFAHERGFVHRDLKPSNILLDQQGEPHVSDFGLGLDLADSETGSIHRGGTRPYMSPEQVRDEVRAIDRRSDVWSLGVMLAEIVHGRRPFPQKDPKALDTAITCSEPQLESAAETAELDVIIRRCLAKLPANRFATAAALADELSNWLRRHFPTGWNRWRYGWRRNVTIAVMCVMATAMIWLGRAQVRLWELEATLSQLESAPAHQIPKLVARLRAANATFDSFLNHPTPTDAACRFRLDVARLAMGDRRAETITRMADALQTAQADEIAAVVQALREADHAADLVRELAMRLSDAALSTDTEMRFRLAAALAGLAPEHPVWSNLSSEVAQSLITRPVEDQQQWSPLFDPIGAARLAEPLRIQMISTKLPRETQTQIGAARALARFLAADVPRLAALVSEADADEIPLLVEGLKPATPKAIPQLRQSFDQLHAQPRVVSTDDSAPPTTNDIQAARLAIALWMLGDPDAACEALRHEPDPTLQTLVIHGLADQAITVKSIIKVLRSHQALHDERSAAIKFGLLQVLALLPPDEVRSQLSPTMLNEWLDEWLDDPDGGIHSAVRLVAARLGLDLAKTSPGEHGRWFVARIGDTSQDFAIVEPCVAEMGIHDLRQAPVLTTPWKWHKRRFPRRIAIATHEVTIGQFRQFDAEFRREDRMLIDSPADAAMMLVTLDAAYGFCNWCSEQARLPSCYEAIAGENGQIRFVPKPDHLSLPGYRLPTDGEWELACRAGTSTSRFFGNEHTLVGRYGWMSETPNPILGLDGALLSQHVAVFLPNRWGLFDTYGSAKEICDTSVDPTNPEHECIDELSQTVDPDSQPMLHGASLEYPGTVFAHSHCRTNRIDITSIRSVGLRVARTLPSRTVDHGVVAP